MRVVKWVVGLLVLAVVAAFLHYILPKREVIFVTDAYNRFVEPGEIRGLRATMPENPGAAGRVGTDVLFIVGRSREGELWEFRNEDASFFPPYFKWDTARLDNLARESVSTPQDPQWMIIRYYGWRIPFFSMFPNAVSMKPAPSPDVRLIPWFNIVFFLVLGALVWAIWSRLHRWRRRRADPVAASWTTDSRRRGWFRRG